MWGLTPQKTKDDPFVKGKNITWQQYEILLAVERAIRGEASRRITIESGHGTGKSACLSWIILWFLFCFKDSQVPCTAPTSDQIHDVLWKELALWKDRMPEPIKKLYDWQTGYLRMTQRPETWFARAKTARKEAPEALAGVHADHVMFVIDEASGVPEEIFNTAEGALTNKNIFVIMISNHTRTVGYFHASHNRDKHNWQTLSLDSRESPIVDAEFVRRIIEKHGEDSDEFRVRVAGRAPKEDAIDDKGFVPLLGQSDLKPTPDHQFVGVVKMGIDPSGDGRDKTRWVIRDRFRAKIVATEAKSTPRSIAVKTLTLMKMYDVQPQNIYCDAFGVGANVAQELMVSGSYINAINVGDPAQDEQFLNRRAEIYWRLKQWLRTGGELVEDQDWESLLTVRYMANLRGKIQLMSKEQMRKEGYPSPDVADALSMTFWDTDIDEQTFRAQEDVTNTVDKHGLFSM
jgi:hypothetical protein